MKLLQSLLLVFTFLSVAARPGSSQDRRAAWFQKARWGVFMHYLAESPALSPEEWNRRINGLNVEGLARQLESVKAGYFFITLGQNSGHYLSPNRTYDQFVGILPSKCSARDLVDDLSRALDPRGIKLLVYLPAGAPDEDKVAMERLEWKRGPYRNLDFQRIRFAFEDRVQIGLKHPSWRLRRN